MKLDISDAKELASTLDLISFSIKISLSSIYGSKAIDSEKALRNFEPALRELHAGLTSVLEL